MKIIVMSDSHGDKETVKAVSSLSADAIFHCGDSELSFDDPILVRCIKFAEIVTMMQRFPDIVFSSVNGKTILAVHGHEHNVKQSLMASLL